MTPEGPQVQCPEHLIHTHFLCNLLRQKKSPSLSPSPPRYVLSLNTVSSLLPSLTPSPVLSFPSPHSPLGFFCSMREELPLQLIYRNKLPLWKPRTIHFPLWAGEGMPCWHKHRFLVWLSVWHPLFLCMFPLLPDIFKIFVHLAGNDVTERCQFISKVISTGSSIQIPLLNVQLTFQRHAKQKSISVSVCMLFQVFFQKTDAIIVPHPHIYGIRKDTKVHDVNSSHELQYSIRIHRGPIWKTSGNPQFF